MRIEAYEKLFLVLTVIMLAALLAAIGASTLAAGIHLPSPDGRVNPATLSSTPPFDQPGAREVAPGQYEVVMIAQVWSFLPAEVRVPAGSTVTFRIASRDVTHGFNIEGTTANLMLVPGQVSTVTVRFAQSGEHLMICHEYCGLGHQQMVGKVIVE